MSKKKTMKSTRIVLGILSVFIIAPIWYYLLYKILLAINATELMLFLFWIYVPLGIFIKIISSIINKEEE